MCASIVPAVLPFVPGFVTRAHLARRVVVAALGAITRLLGPPAAPDAVASPGPGTTVPLRAWDALQPLSLREAVRSAVAGLVALVQVALLSAPDLFVHLASAPPKHVDLSAAYWSRQLLSLVCKHEAPAVAARAYAMAWSIQQRSMALSSLVM